MKPAGKRIGQGMWMLFWLLFLAMLVMLFAKREERLYQPNQELQSVVNGGERRIQLQANRYGHYVLPGRINGQPVQLLLDTGATAVVIPGELADQLGLQRGLGHWARTANGDIEVFRTTIDRLELGPIQLFNVPASVNDHMEGAILLGMSALRQLRISQQDSRLTLVQQL